MVKFLLTMVKGIYSLHQKIKEENFTSNYKVNGNVTERLLLL